MAKPFRLRLFGIVELASELGEPVYLTSQQLALVAIIAVRAPEPTTRAQLVRLLWPDATPGRAGRSLSQTIYAINRKCPDIIGRPTRGQLVINQLAVEIDLGHADHCSPVDVGSTEFLASLATYPSDTFDEWRLATQRQLEERQKKNIPAEPQVAPAAERRHEEATILAGSDQFIGRANELRQLKKHWQECERGAQRAVVIAGPTGIGKTRMLRAVRRLVAISGGSVITTYCKSQGHAGCVLEMLPESGRKNRASSSSANAAAEFSSTITRPTLLAIDDFHRIDDISLEWVQQTLRLSEEIPLLVVVTVTTDDAEERLRTNNRLAVGGVAATWIDLKPLTPAEATKLAELQIAASGNIARGRESEVARITDGIPLFIVDLVRELSAGTPANSNDESRIPLPMRSAALLARRLRTLDRPGLEVMKALAVLGGSGGIAVVSRVCDQSIEVCYESIGRLLAAALVKWEGGVIQVKHQLLLLVTENLLDPLDRRVFHQRAAEAALKIETPDLGAVARHYHSAGLPRLALDYAIRAGEAAELAGELEAALSQFEFVEIAAETESERLHVALRRARIHCRRHQYPAAAAALARYEDAYKQSTLQGALDTLEVMRVIEQLEDGLAPTSVLAERLMAVLARVDSLGDRFVIGCAIQYLLTCAHDAGQEVLVKWVVGAITDGALKSHAGDDPRLFVLAANAECVYGEPSGAHALLDRALSMRGLADPADVAHVCLVRGIAYFVEGRLAEAREELQKARHGNQNARVDGLESRACVNLGVVLLEQGELEKARLVLADARSVASRHEQLVVLANQAVWCIQTGRYDLLVGAISEMESINATLRVQWVEPVCMTLRAFWYLQHGYTSRAVEIADQLAAVMPFGRRDITDMSYSELAICRAWFRDGRAAPAIRRLEDALENFPAAQWAGKLRLLTELASCLRSSDPTRARSILASVRAQARTKGAFAHILAADRVANHLPA